MKILFIDGWTSPKNGWRELILPCAAWANRNADGYNSWSDSVGTQDGVAAYYTTWDSPNRYPFATFDAIIGHSLGGWRAIWLCGQLKYKPKMLMTICPRYTTDIKPASNYDWLMWTDKDQIMTAPEGIPTYNFYTHSPFPSEPMIGARENTDVGSWWPYIAHENAPASEACIARLDWFLKGGVPHSIA